MKLFRSKLLLCTLLGAICCSDGMGAGWKQERLEQVRGALPGNRLYRRALKVLSAQCDSLLTTANPSVMMKECVPASGDRHDYTSLARYYWPDPATADGFPYVRRDGETNPDVDRYDRNRVMEFAGGVYALAVGYWLTDDARYGEKARDMIRTWYLDEATRMNPNLTYSQMIPGRNGGMGRPMGIIDTYLMIDVVDAAQLLEAKGVLAAEEMEALRDWFSELVDWMLTAPNARKIARHGNNLGVAYDAQLIRYALFAGRPEIARRALESFPARRLAVQVEPDGSMPQELRRTKAMSYSIYNVVHMLDICEMGRALGIDLYEAEDRAVERALRFLAPYLQDPESFPYEQINERRLALDDTARQLWRAGTLSGNEEFGRLYERYGPRSEKPIFTLLYR